MKKKIKNIEVACIGTGLVSLDELTPLQGNLKDLTLKNYERCKESILKLGFSEPFSVWDKENSGVIYILNGHMRLKTLLEMREEGYDIPELPVNYIDCKDMKEAKEKVLAFTSQFGEMQQTSLIEFCQDSDLDFDTILEQYRFPEITFITEEEPSADEETVEGEDEGNDETETTTIKVKVKHADRDYALKEIQKALNDLEGLDIK